jgi:hypothetical protein
LWSKGPKHARYKPVATHLTRQQKREIKGHSFEDIVPTTIRPEGVCKSCGQPTNRGTQQCLSCHKIACAETFVAAKHHLKAHTPKTRKLRATALRKNTAAIKNWSPESLPEWLNEEFYKTKIMPLLPAVTRASIASELAVSSPYAAKVRKGERVPHPRHWVKLAKLVGLP